MAVGVIDLTLTTGRLCLFKLIFKILVQGMTFSPSVDLVPGVASYSHTDYSKEKMEMDGCLARNVILLCSFVCERLSVFAQFQLPVAFFSGWISNHSIQPRHRAASLKGLFSSQQDT